MRAGLLTLLMLLGCRAEEPPAPVLSVLLDVALEGGGLAGRSASLARTELAHLAEQAAASMRRGNSPAQALRRALFEAGGFAREIDLPSGANAARFMLLPGVLGSRRGTCVGLGTLYLALAERLGVPAYGVLVPGHFFVRVRDGAQLSNVELLRQGEQMPDGWYRSKYGVPARGGSAYLRELTATEVAAVLRFNLANELREQGRLEQALAKYRRAAADFPAFAEAHASIGLVQQTLGRLSEARRAYQTARELQPTLPGLQRNLALLDDEINRSR